MDSFFIAFNSANTVRQYNIETHVCASKLIAVAPTAHNAIRLDKQDKKQESCTCTKNNEKKIQKHHLQQKLQINA